jgi:hypothetical protein
VRVRSRMGKIAKPNAENESRRAELIAQIGSSGVPKLMELGALAKESLRKGKKVELELHLLEYLAEYLAEFNREGSNTDDSSNEDLNDTDPALLKIMMTELKQLREMVAYQGAVMTQVLQVNSKNRVVSDF